ncbi:hypothetical protein XELAEV_18020729mg [Xenopus laevis]|uniref:Uncharacterized protein n=1 Tax=Xenopus laevis TaxID=8355 RepID=A0A974DA92_XENLA|nr:hypothetical protein XELAEV_18020729mg [Xenopus laevis]
MQFSFMIQSKPKLYFSGVDTITVTQSRVCLRMHSSSMNKKSTAEEMAVCKNYKHVWCSQELRLLRRSPNLATILAATEPASVYLYEGEIKIRDFSNIQKINSTSKYICLFI